MRNIVSFRI